MQLQYRDEGAFPVKDGRESGDISGVIFDSANASSNAKHILFDFVRFSTIAVACPI
jgi:hypothetical protein